MAGPQRSILLESSLETDPRGRWTRWDRENKDDGDLAEKVAQFKSLDHPAGIEASRWLREDAYDNDGLTKTRLLVSDERVEGFISTCFGVVDLTHGGVRRLAVPRHLRRKQVPAFLVCWVARHSEGEIPGTQLMLTAVGLAREAKRNSGLVAFAVDPHDDEVAAMWRSAPWHFQQCRKREDGRQTRLYIPI
jgi:hypothetical protein